MKLLKRGRFWWVDYSVNKQRHRQSTGCTSRAAAQAWVDQIDVARKMPTFEAAVEVLRHFYDKPIEGVIPIEETWNTYQRLAKATGKLAVSSDTVRKRMNAVERLVKWIREKRPTITTLEHVSGPIAAAFAEKLADDGLKSKTRRNIIGDLSAVWNMLEKASTRVRNPWTNLSPVDVDGERGQAFSDVQERAVLDAAKRVGKDWYPICEIMRHTGLRYGDVANLEWREIHADAIRLLPNKTKRHGIAVAIPIIDSLRKVIDAIPRRGDFVFPVHQDLYGRRGATTKAGLVFREVLDAAGISGKGYTIHSWRHTAATRLAEAGTDIETRKRILGHTEDVTARRYDHDEHLEETRRALEKMAAEVPR